MSEKEMDAIIADLHDRIGCADDDGFPPFLFDIVYGVDEDDPYYNQTKIEVPKEVLKLKRKYVDFHEWLDALDIYHDYLEILAEKYGSVSIVMETYNAGEVEEYIPTEPKLKPTKINKQYLRAGIMPPKKVPKPPMKIDFVNLVERMFPIEGEIEDINDAPELIVAPPKRVRKQFDAAIRRIAGEYRQENINAVMRTNDKERTVSMLNTILDNMQRDRYDKNRKYKTANSFTEFLEHYMEDLDADPDFESDEITDRYVNTISSGHIIATKQAKDSEILKIFYQHGIDFMGGKKTNEAIRIAREAVGYDMDERHMSKKELKKYKKKMEKRNEILNHQVGENSALRHILTGNSLDSLIDEDENGDPMLRFGLNDLR